MEIIVAIIKSVVDIFISAPSRQLANSDLQRSRIGKALYGFVRVINAVIDDGEKILLHLESLAQSRTQDEFRIHLQSLSWLIENQLNHLDNVNLHVTLTSEKLGILPSSFRRIKLSQSEKVLMVFNIYFPDSRPLFEQVIDLKKATLSSISKELSENAFKNRNGLIVRDLEMGVDDLLLQRESRSHVEYRSYHLMNEQERKIYIENARKRLDTLKEVRDQFVDFIKTHYEPHQLV
ncbi:MAG: hypothetical protein GXO35_00380 [Gammaproteobacteria bacterium]|nr:hypothetical protein [Gammaproteobacteria bacterium]